MKLRKILGVMLAAAMLAGSVPGAGAAERGAGVTAQTPRDAAAAPFAGRGSGEEPYLIESAAQLRALAELVDRGEEGYAGAHYRLSAGIDLKGEPWEPIGAGEDTPFRGVFDGNGQVITGLSVAGEAPWGGLFGVLEGAEVNGVCLYGSVGGHVRGALAGKSVKSRIRNCVSYCRSSGSLEEVRGAFVGRAEATRVENCAAYYGAGLSWAGEADGASAAVNSFCPGTEGSALTNWYYDGQGMRRQLHDSGEISAVLLKELNAWVEAQGEEYRPWRLPTMRWIRTGGEDYPQQETVLRWWETPLTSPYQFYPIWPVLGEYLVTVEEQVGYRTADGTFVALEGEYATGMACQSSDFYSDIPAWAGAPLPVTVPEEKNPLFRLDEILVYGQSRWNGTGELPAVTGDLSVTVRYVRSGSLRNFTQRAEYTGYIDVDETAWYADRAQGTVADVTRLGLFSGKGNSRFAPEETLSVGEAVKLSAVVHSIYTADGHAFDETAGEYWFDTYKDYALQKGLMAEGMFDGFFRPATRAEAAYLFASALPEEELERRQAGAPADRETEESLYWEEIGLLYAAGVVGGSDAAGTFHPGEPITRAETAAIMVRLVLPGRRLGSKGKLAVMEEYAPVELGGTGASYTAAYRREAEEPCAGSAAELAEKSSAVVVAKLHTGGVEGIYFSDYASRFALDLRADGFTTTQVALSRTLKGEEKEWMTVKQGFYQSGKRLWTTGSYLPMERGRQYLLFLDEDGRILNGELGKYPLPNAAEKRAGGLSEAQLAAQLLPGGDSARYIQWYGQVRALYPELFK